MTEIQQSKQAEIDELKAQLKALHDSRIEFVEYCRKMESGDFVLVSKNQIEVWWQDAEEPENFATKEDGLSFIAQHIEDDEVMEINEHHTVHLPSVTKFGAWCIKNGQRIFFVGTKCEVEAARGGK